MLLLEERICIFEIVAEYGFYNNRNYHHALLIIINISRLNIKKKTEQYGIRRLHFQHMFTHKFYSSVAPKNQRL